MNTISLISAIAVVVSVGGILPQIVAMLQARSSAGQSALGWCLGVLVNGLLGYVNLLGSHSMVLAAGNAVGFLLSATALALVIRYRVDSRLPGIGALDPGIAVSTLLDASRAPLVELPTEELEALQGAVSHARASRERSRVTPACRAREADGLRTRRGSQGRSAVREPARG